jgi:hypothetical protein
MAVSQSSLSDQTSSIARRVESSAADKPIKATDLKKEEKHKREFKDALVSDVALPADDGAAKPQSSSSSAPAQIKNIKK